MIPNRFLFVWMGQSFPYHCRLAIESTLLSNPDAAVEVHIYGPRPKGAEFERVSRYAGVEIFDVEDLHALYVDLAESAERYVRLFQEIPDSAASARSNLLRYGLLHTRGGIYADTDVLILSCMDDLRAHEAFIGKERVWKDGKRMEAGERTLQMGMSGVAWLTSYLLRRADAQLLGGRRLLEKPASLLEPAWATYNQNNAVIGAEPGSRFIRRVLAEALHQPPTVRFALGPTLVTKVAEADDSDVFLCNEETLYPVPPSCSFQFFYGRPKKLPENTRLIHYVASNHKKLLRSLDEDQVLSSRSQALFYEHATRVAADAKSLLECREL